MKNKLIEEAPDQMAPAKATDFGSEKHSFLKAQDKESSSVKTPGSYSVLLALFISVILFLSLCENWAEINLIIP